MVKEVQVPVQFRGGSANPASRPGVLKQVCGFPMALEGSICGLPEKAHPPGHGYQGALVIVGATRVEVVQCPGQVTIDDALRGEIDAESGGEDIEVVAGFGIGGE